MDKNALAYKLQQLGTEIMKLKLMYGNDSELGRETRALVDDKLSEVFKKHYLKNKKDSLSLPKEREQ